MQPYFTLILLVLSIGLSAQEYHLQSSFGVAGLTDEQIDLSPAFDLGLEAAFPVGLQLSILGRAGLQRIDFTDRSAANIPCIFPNGQKIANFTNTETYRMLRTELYLGTGLRYQLGRFQLEGSLRGAVRVHNKLTYTDELNLNRQGTEPTIFTTTLRPGDRFQQNAQTGTIDYKQRFQLQSVVGVAYQFAERFSFGINYLSPIGNYQLERTTLSYCENCEDLEEPVVERTIEAGVKLLRLTGSIRL